MYIHFGTLMDEYFCGKSQTYKAKMFIIIILLPKGMEQTHLFVSFPPYFRNFIRTTISKTVHLSDTYLTEHMLLV